MALTTSLISYWKLDEASGNALDAHGSNELTDVNTVGSATGKILNARDFERGSVEYFTHVDNASLSVGDIDWTWGMWVQLESKSASSHYFVSKGADAYLVRWNAGSDRFEVLLYTGSAYITATANNFGAPSTGVWYYILAWHDATENSLTIQVNNGTIDQVSTSGGFSPDTAGDLVIGDYSTPALGFSHDGLLDEIGFWKRVLTTQERTDLYNSGSGFAYPFSAVGSSIKTWNGLADVITKSWNGIARALIKTWNGVTAVRSIPVIDAVSFNQAVSSTTLTLAHVVGSGANRILIVSASSESSTAGNRPVSGIMWNTSEAFTKVNHVENATGRVEIWYLINPTAGSFNVVLTYGGAAFNTAACATSWTGVKQSAQPDASNTATGTGTAITVNVTTVVKDCIVIDSVLTDQAGDLLTVDASQTQRSNQVNSSAVHGCSSEVKETAGAATMSWTSSASTVWSTIGASFAPA
jgi:hypothetical protein